MRQPLCRLCGNFAQERSVLPAESGGIRAATRVVCTTCGVYDVTMLVDAAWPSYSREDRYRLSGLSRRATERGETLELSTTTVPKLLAGSSTPNPVEQVGLILEYLDEQTSPGGPGAPLSMERDYSIAQALGPDALRFIVNSMAKDGLIERTEKSALPHFRITMAGYERLKGRRDTMSAAPIQAGWEKVHRHIKSDGREANAGGGHCRPPPGRDQRGVPARSPKRPSDSPSLSSTTGRRTNAWPPFATSRRPRSSASPPSLRRSAVNRSPSPRHVARSTESTRGAKIPI
jgi:hypothetical protein